jgi:fucose permease
MFLSGFCIAPYWPTLQVYGAQQLKELDSTMLFIWFSSTGIPGCAFFTWLMGFLGDHIGLEKSLFIVPLSMALYGTLVFLEAFVFPRRKK